LVVFTVAARADNICEEANYAPLRFYG